MAGAGVLAFIAVTAILTSFGHTVTFFIIIARSTGRRADADSQQTGNGRGDKQVSSFHIECPPVTSFLEIQRTF
jgi:hypothetical protein